MAMELTDPDAMRLEIGFLVVLLEVVSSMKDPWYEVVKVKVVVSGTA